MFFLLGHFWKHPLGYLFAFQVYESTTINSLYIFDNFLFLVLSVDSSEFVFFWKHTQHPGLIGEVRIFSHFAVEVFDVR